MAITNTPANQAGAYATNIIQQLNQISSASAAANSRVINGAAANEDMGVPAVAAADLVAALGTTSTLKVKLLYMVLTSSDDTKLAAALTALA